MIKMHEKELVKEVEYECKIEIEILIDISQ